MVNVRMSYKAFLFNAVKLRNHVSENRQHFFFIAGIARIDEQVFVTAFYNCRIAAARRLDKGYYCIISNIMMSYPW